MRMAHDEHDGWPMLHAVWMGNALTLMRMAHMKRMMYGHGMAWVNIDKRFDGIFGWDGDVFFVYIKRLKKKFA